MHGHSKLDAHTSQLITEFISKSGYDPKNFRGVAIDDLAPVERIVERKIFFQEFDVQEGDCVGDMPFQVLENLKTVKLLRFNILIFHTNDIDSFFKL